MMLRTSALVGLLSALPALSAAASPLTVDPVINNSSGSPFYIFSTQSELSSVVGSNGTYSFTHRMAALSSVTAIGEINQANTRNINYIISFTVLDPGEVGYNIELDSLLRGVSYINQTVADTNSIATATGIKWDARYGVDLADINDVNSYTNLPLPIFNMETDGVSVTGLGTDEILSERREIDALPGGTYVGSKTFSLYFTTSTTSTTNVFFQNQMEGEGFSNYGLGMDVRGFDVEPEDLGHFLNVEVSFVPEPTSGLLIGAGLALTVARRRR